MTEQLAEFFRRRLWALIETTLLASLVAGCATNPVMDACLQGDLVSQPMLLARTKAAVDEFNIGFDTPGNGNLCVIVENGVEHGTKVRRGQISVDVDPLQDPLMDFAEENIESGRTREEIALEHGAHTLKVRLGEASLNGAERTPENQFITVSLRFYSVHTEADQGVSKEIERLKALRSEQFQESYQKLDHKQSKEILDSEIVLGNVPGALRIRMSPYGIPRRLDNIPIEEYGQEPRDAAEKVGRKWLDHHRDLFRIHDAEVELLLDNINPGKSGASRVRFKQKMSGLWVDNARIELTVDGQQVSRMVGNFVPDRPKTLVPTLTTQEAVERAMDQDYKRDEEPIGKPELVVFDDSEHDGVPRVRLAWRLVVSRKSEFTFQTLWIDAQTGETIRRSNNVEKVPVIELYTGKHFASHAQPDPEPLTLLEDTGGVTDTGCFEEWCTLLLQAAALLDLEWRVFFDRDGWSDDGLWDLPGEPRTAIPPNDNIRIVMDPDGAFSAWFGGTNNDGLQYDFPFRPGFPSDGRFIRLDKTTSFQTQLPNAIGPSWDVLRHEMGHALYQVEVGLRGNARESRPDSFRYMTEHAAEFWAILNEDDETPFAHTRQNGLPSIIDQSKLDCELFECENLCDKYEHYNLFLEDISIDSDLVDWPHKNACVLGRLAFRATNDRSRSFAHGVSSRGLGFTTARHLFYELFTEHATVNDDILDYAENYRASVSSLNARCDPESGPGGRVCRDDRDPLIDGMDPLWGLGFYSNPIELRNSIGRLQTRNTMTALNIEGKIHLLYSDLNGRLIMAEYADPISGQPPIINRQISLLMPGDPTIEHFGAAVEEDGTILLAYVADTPTDNLVVARITLDPFSVTIDNSPGLTGRGFRAAADRPAIIDDEGSWIVVVSEESTFDLHMLEEGGLAPILLPRDANDQTEQPEGCGLNFPPDPFSKGNSPLLVRNPLNKHLYLFYLGSRSVHAPRVTNLVMNRVMAQNRRWCYPISAHTYDASNSDQFKRFSTNAAPSVSFFPQPSFLPPIFPRLQIHATQRYVPVQASLAARREAQPLNLRAWDDGVSGDRKGSRIVAINKGVPIADTASVAYDHPIHGEILLVYQRHVGGTLPTLRNGISLSYKRSD